VLESGGLCISQDGFTVGVAFESGSKESTRQPRRRKWCMSSSANSERDMLALSGEG